MNILYLYISRIYYFFITYVDYKTSKIDLKCTLYNTTNIVKRVEMDEAFSVYLNNVKSGKQESRVFHIVPKNDGTVCNILFI